MDDYRMFQRISFNVEGVIQRRWRIIFDFRFILCSQKCRCSGICNRTQHPSHVYPGRYDRQTAAVRCSNLWSDEIHSTIVLSKGNARARGSKDWHAQGNPNLGSQLGTIVFWNDHECLECLSGSSCGLDGAKRLHLEHRDFCHMTVLNAIWHWLTLVLKWFVCHHLTSPDVIWMESDIVWHWFESKLNKQECSRRWVYAGIHRSFGDKLQTQEWSLFTDRFPIADGENLSTHIRRDGSAWFWWVLSASYRDVPLKIWTNLLQMSPC